MAMRLGVLIAALLAGAPASPSFIEVSIVSNNPGGASEVNWGDYDADGDLDIALLGPHGGGAYSRIYKQTGGAFDHDTNAVLHPNGEGPIVFGDYDNDGDLDLVVAGYDGGTSDSRMYRNDGAVGFVFLNNGLQGVKGSDAQWADLDNDGDLDLVLAGESYQAPGGDHAKIYRNDGGGAFTLTTNLSGIYLGQVSAGDYDRDGDYDLAISGRGTRSRVYRNDNGTFVDLNLALEAATIQSTMAWGDYDADGDLDFILCGTDILNNLYCEIYRNDGGDVFTALGNSSVAPIRLGEFEWGDYDNDGDLDLVGVGDDGAGVPVAKLYRNDGSDTFVDSGETLTPLLNQSSAAWGDYDGDGDLDLLTGGMATSFSGPWTLKVYRNDGAAANAAPSVPAGLSSTSAAGSTTFSWTASTDDHTPAVALTYNLRVGTLPGGSDVMAAQRVPRPGNAQTNLSWTLKNIPPGPLYWSVQAVDGAYRTSAWATEAVAAGPPAPKIVATSLVPPILTVTLDLPPYPGSVNATSVVLTRGAGIPVTPALISVAGNVITVDLTGLTLPDDTYELRLRGMSDPLVSHAGIYARWALDEGAGTSTSDASGNGRNGTLAGGAAWTGGLFGNGIRFEPGQTRVSISSGGVLPPPWTAAFWVRRTDSPGIESCLLDCDASQANGTSLRLEQFSPANRVGYTRYNIADYSFDYVAPVDVWVHLTFVGGAGGVELYVDGAFEDSHNVPIDLFVGYLGGHKASAMKGVMDEAQIYDRALLADEIAALAATGGAVRGTNGVVLDGDGDGNAGGDFTGTFGINTTTDLKVGGCGLLGLEAVLLLLWVRRGTKRAVCFVTAFLVCAGPLAAQEVEPVPAASPPPEEPCAGIFASARAGVWRRDEFDAAIAAGRRQIERGSMGVGGVDLGWRLHQLQTWVSFDYASGDDVEMGAVGAHVGWRQRLPTGESLPLWGTLAAGVLAGRLEVDASGFGDFDPAIGFQARAELGGRFSYSLGASIWADFRHLAFDYDEAVLSGDDEAIGGSIALGGALTLRF